jgi:nucleotide-binding universal stress UspA family protein
MTSSVRNILAAVDLSSCSRAALDFACSLATSLNAKIEVLFVLDGAHTSNPGDPTEIDAAREELHRFITSVLGTRHPALTDRVEVGNARERIVAVSAKGFDAIVLGTHGRTGRVHELAGSVAESVVRTAAIPVITVRERS